MQYAISHKVLHHAIKTAFNSKIFLLPFLLTEFDRSEN